MFALFHFSMDGFRVVRMEEVIKQVDILVTCTGVYSRTRIYFK